MQTLIEETNSFGSLYRKYRNGKLIKTVQIISLQETVDGYDYIIILDNRKQIIFEVYEYLNFHLQNFSYKKRELAMNALKLFFSFAELFNIYDYKSINKKDLNKLLGFLEGGYSSGNLAIFNINTVRSNKTINMYLSIYRQFFNFLEIKDNIFNEKSIAHTHKSNTRVLGPTTSVSTEKYIGNLTEIHEKRVPKYIKVYEYEKILNLIDNSKSSPQLKLRNKLIIKLMYNYGFRISEVLGLTIEDLDFNIYKLSDNKVDMGRIILRNRVSDKQYHHCKNLHIPKSIEEYNPQSKYHTANYGYKEVFVDINLLKQIQEYIDMTMDVFNMTPVAIDRLTKRIADKVSNNTQIKNNNYYIFISKNYTPITIDGWNKIIRSYFKALEIPLDNVVKENNLNHRFRHGFAMNLKKLGYDKLDIMKKLRHSKVSSVAKYFNPDTEDDINTAKEISTKSRELLGIKI